MVQDETHYTADDRHRRELARKLRLLMDVAEANKGTPLTWQEISDDLASKGIQLGRARWSYMLNGSGPSVKAEPLLSALAEFFGVDAQYLLDHRSEGLPDRIDAQLHLVQELRIRRITSFAARTLDGATPEAIRELTEAIKTLDPSRSDGKSN